ncbi:MAG: hypothetical protein Q7J78_05325 [Clostridiales bacterium]|nr:hypothetical protein [Clostridiales bacterium]
MSLLSARTRKLACFAVIAGKKDMYRPEKSLDQNEKITIVFSIDGFSYFKAFWGL